MLTTPSNQAAESGSNNSGSQPATAAPIKIAPIKFLPGVVPRLDDPVEDNPTDENVENVDPEQENTDETEGAPGKKVEETKKVEPAKTKPVVIDGKTFADPEAAIKYAAEQLKIARNAQAKADRNLAPILKRLEQLEAGTAKTAANPANLPETGTLDSETQEFWRQTHAGLVQINSIEDVQERAKQQLFFTAAIAQKLVEDARQSILDELGGKIKPFEEQAAETQNLNVAEQTFRSVMNEVDEDGTPLYPEMHEEKGLADIIKTWRNYEKVGIPKKILYHPDHIKMIVLAYRAANGNLKKMEAALPLPTPIPTPTPKPVKHVSPVTAGGFTPPNLNKGTGVAGMRIPGVFAKV